VACGGAEPEGPNVEGAAVGVVGAHEHGVARLALTASESKVFVVLEAPGDALFGFERAPRTEEEVTLVAERVARLDADLASAVVMPPALYCRADGPVRMSGVPKAEMADAEEVEGHDHEEGHDHGEGDDHQGEHAHDEGEGHEEGEDHADHDDHLEVTAELTLICDASPMGQEAQLQIGELLPSAEQIDLTVLTDLGEDAARVSTDARFTF